MAGSLSFWQPCWYRGYVYDEETGLYYLRNRYYGAQRGRFLNADSLTQDNCFSYCHNLPVNRYDKDGMKDYATLGPGASLYRLIYEQEAILAYSSGLLDEQERIIKNKVPYLWGGMKDEEGYDCATFYSSPLEKTSKADNGTFIRMPTGIHGMLTHGSMYFLFIVNINDYDIADIPEGAFFMRDKGFIKDEHGHGVTLKTKNPDGTITYNNAEGVRKGIHEDTEPYESFKARYQYVGWPKGLGIPLSTMAAQRGRSVIVCEY